MAQQARFLRLFADVGVVRYAAEQMRLDPHRHFDWMHDPKYPDYPRRFEEAKELAVQRLEREMIRRGAEGWDKPVYQGGKRVGLVREYSDLLLIFALRAKRPEVYRERHELNVNQKSLTLQITPADLKHMSTEEIRMAVQLARKMLRLEGQAADAEPLTLPGASTDPVP